MAEALGRMINRKKKSDQIHGMKPGPNYDPISHHQLVNDTIIEYYLGIHYDKSTCIRI